MALPLDRQFEHLLRRAGFGARSDELDTFRRQSIRGAVDLLTDFEDIPDDVDSKIGQAGYALMTMRGQFSPRTVIGDARQRWLFRMVHTNRPLQEKMTLFWHNHFATAYAKINGLIGSEEATRYLAAKPSEDPAGVRGQLEMLRDNALGNFRDMLVDISKDVAMLVLAGRPHQRAPASAGELRSRDHGAVHDGRRQLHRGRRLRRGSCVHRLESRPSRVGHRRFAALRVSVTSRRSTTSPTRRSAFRSIPDGGKTIRGARRGRRHAGRDSISSTRWSGIRRRRATWARNCIASSSPRPATIDERWLRAAVVRLLPEPLRHACRHARGAALRRVLGSGVVLHALLVAGRVRRARDQGHRLARLLARLTR